jgi:hypothetical protein
MVAFVSSLQSRSKWPPALVIVSANGHLSAHD